MEDVLETLLGLEIVDEHDQAADLRKVARQRAKLRQQAAAKVAAGQPGA
jgi:CBS domain containing-hemolysin-like protein